MLHSKVQEFGRWRNLLWPVHRHELRKFIPMLMMSFLIGFNYHILRSMKDSLLITASGGAMVIPFVKVWAMLPMAILLTSIFVKLSHKYSLEKVFYYVMTGFVGFYLIFAFILYPLRDVIHPHQTAAYLESVLPAGFQGMIGMLHYWSFSLFYTIAELWGTIVLNVLFWGFANEVTKLEQAGRFYALIGLGANFASIAAGRSSFYLCHREYNPNWIIGSDLWHQSLILLTVAVAVSGLLLMVVFRWFSKNVQATSQIPTESFDKRIDKVKKKGSIRENIRYLLKSRYLVMVAVIVLGYNIIINLTEVLWKDQVHRLHPDGNDYQIYMSNVTTVTGIIATILAWVVCSNVIRKFGWTFTALLTPAVLLITSVGFFGFYFFPEHKLAWLTAAVGMSPLALVALIGSIQNCLSRAAKYTLFDQTQAMTFIPLDRDSRIKGKAAIDGVGSRLGKSGGSLIYQGLLLTCGSIALTAPFIGVAVFLVLGGWIMSVKSVGRKFARLSESQAQEAAASEPEPATRPAQPALEQPASV